MVVERRSLDIGGLFARGLQQRSRVEERGGDDRECQDGNPAGLDERIEKSVLEVPEVVRRKVEPDSQGLGEVEEGDALDKPDVSVRVSVLRKRVDLVRALWKGMLAMEGLGGYSRLHEVLHNREQQPLLPSHSTLLGRALMSTNGLGGRSQGEWLTEFGRARTFLYRSKWWWLMVSDCRWIERESHRDLQCGRNEDAPFWPQKPAFFLRDLEG